MHRTWFAPLAALALCLCANAQEDVADVEFKDRAALHAAAPAVGSVVPDLVLVSLEGRPVALTSLRGRYVVAIRAGYTSQSFRDAAAGLKKLQERFVYSPSVTFLVVVGKEPAAGQAPFEAIAQPKTFAERLALAERMRDELDVVMPMYVDDVDDASNALFDESTSSVVALDREGRVVDKLATPDANALQRAVVRLLHADKMPHEMDDLLRNFEVRDALVRRARLEGTIGLRLLTMESGRREFGEDRRTPAERGREALSRDWSRAPEFRGDSPFEPERREIEAAWGNDPMRLLAARVELAEIRERNGYPGRWSKIPPLPTEGVLGHIRSWLERRNRTEDQLLADFDEKTRARVKERLAAHAQARPSLGMQSKLAVVRVRFEHGNAYALDGADRLGLRFGRGVNLVDGADDMPKPIAEGERTALILQTYLAGVTYKAQLFELAKK